MIASLGMFLGCLLVILLPLLGGCGGGAAPSIPAPAPAEQPAQARAVRVAFLGDSLTAGFDGAHPVDRIREQLQGGIEPEDLSLGGTAAVQFIEGIAPIEGLSFAQWIAKTDAQIVVIRYGGIEALFDPSHDLMRGFAGHIEHMVAMAQARGITVALVGRITIPENDMADAAFQVRYAATDATLRDISARTGAAFIDLSGVPVYAGEMADAIHPGKAYQDRASEVIANTLAEIIKQQKANQ